jgi:glycosyltransferase involved in cell wall biosynthesis
VAAALRRVLDDPDRAAGIVDAGQDRLSQLDWDRTVDGLVEIYRTAVAARGGPGRRRALP